jgi:1-acyl-sn-glycerol-3-phosphate acyltransferase
MRIAQHFEDKAIHGIFTTLNFYGGFKPRVVNKLNEDLPRRFMVVSNHQSLLDIVVIMRTLPPWAKARFVAKKELGYGIPLISLILRVSGHSLVRRKGDALEAMRKVTRMARRCRREGTIPVIFPEGTRSRTGELGRFHSAGYRKILEVEPIPILVASMEGGWKIANIRDFLFNFGNIPFTASYLALLPAPHSKKEALETLEKSRKIIEASLEEQRNVQAPEA